MASKSLPWSKKSLSEEGNGLRRFLEFVDQVKREPITVDGKLKYAEVNPRIVERVINEGWRNVFGRNSNFDTNAEAAKHLYLKDNPSVKVSMDNWSRFDEAKEWSDIDRELAEIIIAIGISIMGIKSVGDLVRVDRSKFARLIVTDIPSHIDNVLSKLETRKGNWEANFSTGSMLAKHLGKFGNIQSMKFHYRDSVYNEIRDKVRKPIRGGADRWNPADVYVDVGGAKFREIMDARDIVELNNIFNEEVRAHRLIPVSLKQDKKSMCGSLSVNNVLDGYKVEKAKKLYADEVVDLLGKCISKSKIPFDLALSSKPINVLDIDSEFSTARGYLGALEERVRDLGDDGLSSYRRTYPPVLRLILETCKFDSDKFNEIWRNAILRAHSFSKTSSLFYLCNDSEFKLLGDSFLTVNLIRFVAAVNTIAVLLECDITDGAGTKRLSCQIRSKGRVPQIILNQNVLSNNYRQISL